MSPTVEELHRDLADWPLVLCGPMVRRVTPDVPPMIELDRENPDRRLQLVLAGDQIYSDDVPAAMLAAPTAVGRLLTAWDDPEVFPDR